MQFSKYIQVSILSVVLLIVCVLPIVSQESDPLKGARVSFVVKDVSTGEIMSAVNPDLCVTPASITKLITTSSAVEILGGDYRFTTTIEHDGYIDENGTLHGNLIVRGGGDPTFGSAFVGSMNVMSELLQKVRYKGIKQIEGNIVADASIYNSNPVPITWCYEDVATHYGQGTYGLSVRDNICHITLESREPGSKPTVLNVNPKIDNFLIETPVEVLKYPDDSIFIFGMPGENKRIINGGMPANVNRYPVRCDIPNPPMLVVQMLKNRIVDAGISVSGEYTDNIGILGDTIHHLFEYKSPKLKEIIKHTNFKSNNMYAEHILRQIATTTKKKNIAEWDGVSVVLNYWKKKGVNTDFVFLKDGSGMSPMDSYNANFLTDILVEMTKSERFSDFYNSIPIAGKEGTVAGLLRRTPLEGKARVKSGSMSHVQCYAGYINYNNKQYAFTVMVNYYACSRRDVRKIITKMIVDSVTKR